MRLFRVLPALTLLIRARAYPRVLDSGKPASHHVKARQIGTNLCVPIGPAATIEELLPPGFVYLTRGNAAAASKGSTFLSLSLWLSVSVFMNDFQRASACRPFPARLPSRLPNSCTNLRPSQLTNLKTIS